MKPLLAKLFISGIELSGPQRLLLILPLCLAIAVVYKTTRCGRIRDIPLASFVLWMTIVAGMFAVGLGLWMVYRLAA